MFIQSGPDDGGNLFKQDSFLQGLTRRYLPEEAYLLMLPTFLGLGEDISTKVKRWSEHAENNPPSLQNFDAFGHRIDRLDLPQGWSKLKRYAWHNRLVALGYDKGLKRWSRCAQTACQIMFSAYSSTYSCPLAMTDGAIRLLQEHGPQSVKESIIPLLLGRDDTHATCGQWMTERIGGSDLRHIETHATLARKEDDVELYRLYGLKWFASAIDSDYALVLAKIQDSGPSLFLLKVWHGGELGEGIKLDRLKNKLGTKGLPTAEVRLEGAIATLIGPSGRGIRVAAPLLNMTRFYNALASASIMNRAFFAVRSYAKKRHSFNKPLDHHKMYKMLLADLDAKRCGSIALCFEIARLLGQVDDGDADRKENKILRALIPIAKLHLGKWAVYFASEAMEAIGGIGYLEDSEFPKLLRDAQVLPIWEGSTNMMLHDMMRAQNKENALVILLKDLCERANAVMIDEMDAMRILKARLQRLSERVMVAINKADGSDSLYLEPMARKTAFTVGSCAMALLLAEAKPFITGKDDLAPTRFTTFVENNLCGHFSL